MLFSLAKTGSGLFDKGAERRQVLLASEGARMAQHLAKLGQTCMEGFWLACRHLQDVDPVGAVPEPFAYTAGKYSVPCPHCREVLQDHPHFIGGKIKAQGEASSVMSDRLLCPP